MMMRFSFTTTAEEDGTGLKSHAPSIEAASTETNPQENNLKGDV